MPHDVLEANGNLAGAAGLADDIAAPTYEAWAERVVLERLRIMIPIASTAAVAWAILAARGSARVEVWVASGASSLLAIAAFVALARSATLAIGLAVFGTAIASGAFAAAFGGLQSVAAAGLITPWVFGAVVIPRRLFILPAVLSGHAAAFVITSWLLGGAPDREPAVLLIAGVALVIVTAGAARRRNYDRRDFDAWTRFRETLRLVELRRAELQHEAAALEESARLQVAETVAHAKTTRALEEELSKRVATRSRRLASAVDRASSPELSVFGSVVRDALVGARARILDRMTPAPYEPSFLAIDRTQPARRLLVSGVEIAGEPGARLVEELTKGGVDHPCLARVVDAGSLDGKAVFWAAEHRAGAALFRAMPRADFGMWDAARIIQAAAAALADAHDRGVYHLGLDPYRIVLGAGGSGLTIHGAGLLQACARAPSPAPLDRTARCVRPPPIGPRSSARTSRSITRAPTPMRSASSSSR